MTQITARCCNSYIMKTTTCWGLRWPKTIAKNNPSIRTLLALENKKARHVGFEDDVTLNIKSREILVTQIKPALSWGLQCPMTLTLIMSIMMNARYVDKLQLSLSNLNTLANSTRHVPYNLILFLTSVMFSFSRYCQSYR